jgi:hypothetical protein
LLWAWRRSVGLAAYHGWFSSAKPAMTGGKVTCRTQRRFDMCSSSYADVYRGRRRECATLAIPAGLHGAVGGESRPPNTGHTVLGELNSQLPTCYGAGRAASVAGVLFVFWGWASCFMASADEMTRTNGRFYARRPLQHKTLRHDVCRRCGPAHRAAAEGGSPAPQAILFWLQGIILASESVALGTDSAPSAYLPRRERLPHALAFIPLVQAQIHSPAVDESVVQCRSADFGNPSQWLHVCLPRCVVLAATQMRGWFQIPDSQVV